MINSFERETCLYTKTNCLTTVNNQHKEAVRSWHHPDSDSHERGPVFFMRSLRKLKPGGGFTLKSPQNVSKDPEKKVIKVSF